MKIPFCSPAEAKRFTTYLHSRYGIPFSALKEWRWIQYKESVFAVTSACGDWVATPANIFSMGLLVFSDAHAFEPTSNFITLMGKEIRQNVVPLSPIQLESFFQRKKMEREQVDVSRVLSEGYVGVSFNGKVVGSAQLTRNHLIPNLPPTHHATESD